MIKRLKVRGNSRIPMPSITGLIRANNNQCSRLLLGGTDARQAVDQICDDRSEHDLRFHPNRGLPIIIRDPNTDVALIHKQPMERHNHKHSDSLRLSPCPLNGLDSFDTNLDWTIFLIM